MGRRVGCWTVALGGVWERMRALCEPRPDEAPLRVGDVVSAAARLGAKRLCLDAGPAAARLRMRCAVRHLSMCIMPWTTRWLLGLACAAACACQWRVWHQGDAWRQGPSTRLLMHCGVA